MKFKRAGAATKLLILVLLAASVIGLLTVRGQLTKAQAQRDLYRSQVQVQQESNAALADAIEHSDDLEYILNIARSKLGLLEVGEIRFVDTSN